MNAIRLYLRYLTIALRSSMQYRASFLLQSFANFLITGFEFLGLVGVFQRFHHIRGWMLPEIAFFYGVISLAFAIAEAVPRSFDVFPRLIQSGDFDRLLLRPRSTALQVLGQDFQPTRLGRFTQGLAVFLWAAYRLQIVWTVGKIVLVIAAILGGACLFSGLIICQATMCFWTIDSIEIVNCTTYGGMETAQFPLTIYHRWFRNVFVFIIPLATINYFPAHFILGRPETAFHTTSWMQCASPLVGLLFLIVCLQLWRLGVRHYHSTGS